MDLVIWHTCRSWQNFGLEDKFHRLRNRISYYNLSFLVLFIAPSLPFLWLLYKKILEHFDDKDNEILDFFFFFLPLRIVLQIMSGLINN